MNRLLLGTLALGLMLCMLFVQSDATQLPVPSEQLSVPEPQAADASAPAAATAETAETDEYETVTVYKTEYRDVRVCDGPGRPCRIVRQAVRVPVQVTRKVAKAATAVVRSAVCQCGCGGTCGGLCDCLNCSCKGAAAGEVVRFHSVRTSPPVVTSVGGYRVYTPVYRPQVQRRAAWRPFARLRAFRGGCR